MAVRRYLSCLRYRDTLVLQGAPLLGAVFTMGQIRTGWVELLVFAFANLLLVLHVFVFNDWSGIDDDLNDVYRSANVFAAKGISPESIRFLWIALLVSSLLLFCVLGLRLYAIALAIAALSFLYSGPTLPAKGIPVLSSAIHLGGGALHFLLGYSLFSAIDGRGMALALFFGLAFAAGHLNQEVRDFDPDISNDIRTNAVAFGKRTTFLAGLVVFTLAYAQLAVLASAGIVPRGLFGLVLLYPLHVYWSWRALGAGLSFESIRRFQGQYRTLFAIVGLGLLAALLFTADGRTTRPDSRAQRTGGGSLS